LPDVPVYLNEVLACADFLGGTEPRIGRKHIGVLAIDGFPDISTPGMLRELDALRIEYRWNTRAILLDPEEARPLLDKIKKKWKSKVRGWFAQLFKDQEAPVNEYALDQQKDAEQAAAVAASGNVQFVHYSSNVVCLDEDPVKLRVAIREVMRVIQNLGFSCRLEDINAIEAWRGTIPGDGYSNVRRVILHTLNLADLLPTTSVWAGLKENPSALMPKHSPPLLFAATGGATPFRLNLHVSDLGHTLVVGPSGTGKSTLLGLIGAQWFRYPAAQVFCFDKGYSMWMLTQAAGGTFYDLAGVGNAMGFCPLREIDSDADLAWAVSWLECLCVLSGSSLGPRERTALTEAVIQLRLSPTRTLTELQANVQDHRVREALNHYTLSGAMGVMLDREEDMLTDGSRFVTFETEHLLQMDAKGIIPVLLYLFRSIERRLDGSPTLIILDEAWAYLRHDLFRERLRDWLKTMRKKNAAVIMAVQQISDLSRSEIADLLFESPTKILMPNAEAKTANARLFYERAGLNERELDQLALAIPKKNYYVVSVLGKRMVDLGIAPASLSFVGINSQEERQQIKTLMSERPDEWRAEWLRSRGLPDWAEYYEQLEEQCSGQSVTE
jgi:type IV secretion system protein VirB4